MARFGIDKVKPGSPILSILEAAAQSDVRSTQDIFSYLNSINLDRATGDALDKIGADEDAPRLGQTFGTGVVTISDTSFAKKVTKIYVGTPAPIVGTIGANFYVADATGWPTTGSIYIGRGTTNYEGPIAYTALTFISPYWRLNLTTATQKFHNLQESVILAQGGNRTVTAGTVVETAQGNANQAVQFSTLYSITVPDGEIETTGVSVVAKVPGLAGRINAAAIVSFTSAPFTGAAVTNPLPFSNARPTENGTDYKERIRNIRQTRSKGTPLAITSGVLGILAPDENKTVLSAAVITRQGYPATLYIDDGTGYEERTSGVSIEGIVDSATGGERYFQINNRPVAKAFLESSIIEPFTLVSGAVLAVKVNGITYKHTFSGDSFRNVANASAYEVVSSINSDPAVPFNARLAGNGDKVNIIADTDTQEGLEVVEVDDDEIDANQWLGFSVGRVDTMLLYKNDRLLFKDGRTATITSNSLGAWAAGLTSPATLSLAIDNTPAVVYSFTAQDFIDAQTGYVVLASANGLAAWAAVLNSRLPGVTATVGASAIVLTSNLDNDSRSRLVIDGGTLVAEGMFPIEDSEGAANDFTLDRNTGQIRLESVLEEGDVLAVGTANTRAFVQSLPIPTTDFTVDAESWWVVDGQATIIPSGVGTGVNVKFTLAPGVVSGTTWGKRIRISVVPTAAPFTLVEQGDWAIINDEGDVSPENKGAFRVAYVDPGGVFFEVERPASPAFIEETVAFTTGGLVFVRTVEPVQLVTIPADDKYTAAGLADVLTLRGATAYVNRTNQLRVRTNTFDSGGDIALVAQDTESAKMLLTPGDYVQNLTSHLGAVVTGSTESGTPEFIIPTISTVTNSTVFVRTAVALSTVGSQSDYSGHQLAWIKPQPDTDDTTSVNYTDKAGDWTVGENVTGATSATTGVIDSVLGGAPGDITGTIVLTSVTGTGFIAGEVLTGDGVDTPAAISAGDYTVWKDRWSEYNQHTSISTSSGTTITVRNALERLKTDRFYAASPFAIGPNDDLAVLIDEDEQSQRYAMPMYRKGKPSTGTYGTVNIIKDVDNSNASLVAGFGDSFDWLDYAVWMRARAKTHNEAGTAGTTKTVLYRYNRFGLEGNQVYLRYVYPTAASQAISVTTDSLTDGQTQVYISIPSGAARTGVTVRNSTKIGTYVSNGAGAQVKTVAYILGFNESSANTVVRLRVKLPQTGTGDFAPGDVVTGGTSLAVATVASVNYASAGRGYIEFTATPAGGSFVTGETLSSPTGGVHTGTADSDQYGLVTATIDVSSPLVADHGFNSHIILTDDTSQFVVGDTIRGENSNTIAIVTAIPDGFRLVVREVSGAFDTVTHEDLTATGYGPGAGTVISVTAGDVLFVTSSSGSYASGAKNIIGRTATTIQYIEAAAAIAPVATPGKVSFDVGLATLVGSTVVLGDLANLGADADHADIYKKTVVITGGTASQFWYGSLGPVGDYTNSSVVTWAALNQATNLSFFVIATASAKASDFATAVNALAAASPSVPITAVAVGNGSGDATGVISQASFDEFDTIADKHYTLTDGMNWIRSQAVGADYTFTFKNAITAASTTNGNLATNSDWAAEDLRLVPVTSKNVVDWMNAPTVSGLSSVAEVATSTDGNKPQISTLLSGRVGSVRVQGGSSNSLSAAVQGAATSIASTYASATISYSDAIGLSGGQWVAIQNFSVIPKIVFTPTTVIESIDTTGLVTLDTGFAWTYANVAATPLDVSRWQIEKQGRYVSYSWDGIGSAPVLTGISEGDWVIISGAVLPDLSTATINSRNQGTFRVVRTSVAGSTATFWIENPNYLEETKLAHLTFLTYDSVMVGDSLLINTPTLGGADNQGAWRIASIDSGDRQKFTLDVDRTLLAYDNSGLDELGSFASHVQIVEGTPSKLVKKIRAISPNAEDSSYLDIKFETVTGYRLINEAAGSVIQSLDKLDFPVSLVEGVDGYRYSTGLIREANRVAYGDPTDPASYPGIVAAGARVNIEGPLVRRITCSLALRLKTGVGENDVKVRVRSAVASVINDTDVGASISISSLIDAAQAIPGVTAVTWLAPEYGAGNDLISVQPFEKPLVLDLVEDIRISLVSR